MVFSVAWLAAAARVPAELCQGAARAPGQRRRRRLRADEVLRALLVLPARELERLADWLFVFFCLPLPDYYVPGSGRGGLQLGARPSGMLVYGGRYRRSLSLSSPSPSSSSSSSSSLSSSSEYYYYYSDY